MHKNKKLKAMSSSFSLLLPCIAIIFSLLLIMSPIRLSVPGQHIALAFKPTLPSEKQVNNNSSLTSGGKANVTSQTRATAEVSILTYENSSYGIKLQYPSDWSFFRPGSASNASGPTPIVLFYPSSINLNTDLLDTFVAVNVDNSPGKNLSQYLSKTAGDYAGTSMMNVTMAADCKEHICLAGHSAIAYFYIDRPNLGVDPNRPDHTKIFTIINDKAYIIEYSVKHELYDKYFPTVLKMIDSFTVGNSNNGIPVCVSCPTDLAYLSPPNATLAAVPKQTSQTNTTNCLQHPKLLC